MLPYAGNVYPKAILLAGAVPGHSLRGHVKGICAHGAGLASGTGTCHLKVSRGGGRPRGEAVLEELPSAAENPVHMHAHWPLNSPRGQDGAGWGHWEARLGGRPHWSSGPDGQGQPVVGWVRVALLTPPVSSW